MRLAKSHLCTRNHSKKHCLWYVSMSFRFYGGVVKSSGSGYKFVRSCALLEDLVPPLLDLEPAPHSPRLPPFLAPFTLSSHPSRPPLAVSHVFPDSSATACTVTRESRFPDAIFSCPLDPSAHSSETRHCKVASTARPRHKAVRELG